MEKEYLLLGNTRETQRIDSSDICYIRASGNKSAIFLTRGDFIVVTMQLGIIKEIMSKSLKCFEKDFFSVGRSFVVNKKNLSYINTTDQILEFYGKHTEDYLKGYKDGYLAGHRDGLVKSSPSVTPPDAMVLKADKHTQLPQEDLKDLMDSFKENIIVVTNEK